VCVCVHICVCSNSNNNNSLCIVFFLCAFVCCVVVFLTYESNQP